jgi:hypothetical protein
MKKIFYGLIMYYAFNFQTASAYLPCIQVAESTYNQCMSSTDWVGCFPIGASSTNSQCCTDAAAVAYNECRGLYGQPTDPKDIDVADQ